MLDKKRGIAYRKMLAGLRFHQDENISHIQFGLQRGSIKDLRTIFKQLTTWIKRDFGIRIEFCRVEVWENTDSTKGDDRTRIHCHMLWNAPYIKQALILEKFELYLGENANVHIKLVDDHKKASRYLLQYLGYKQTTCYFSYSRRWLPKGYNDQFKAVKQDFYEKVSLGFKKPLESHEQYIKKASQSSDEWRKAVLVDMMNDWIDEQRKKGDEPIHDQGRAQLNYWGCLQSQS